MWETTNAVSSRGCEEDSSQDETTIGGLSTPPPTSSSPPPSLARPPWLLVHLRMLRGGGELPLEKNAEKRRGLSTEFSAAACWAPKGEGEKKEDVPRQ